MTAVAEKTRHLEQALRDAGLRMTRQRLVLLEVIAGASDHPDAAELHKRVQARDAGVSLATVYRTLSELEASSATLLMVHLPGLKPLIQPITTTWSILKRGQ
jgi:Fe2+ or Zn2+ uptake regulation protein